MQNIELKRPCDIEDYDVAVILSTEDCECTKEMKKELKHGDETICRPCAARQVLNGLTSLVDDLNQE